MDYLTDSFGSFEWVSCVVLTFVALFRAFKIEFRSLKIQSRLFVKNALNKFVKIEFKSVIRMFPDLLVCSVRVFCVRAFCWMGKQVQGAAV
jgi:hypothetical protein